MAKERDSIYTERARAAAASNANASRSSLIEFHKSFARANQGKKIASGLRAEEASSTELADTGGLLERMIAKFAAASDKMEDPEFELAIARLSIAMFLTERTAKLRDFALGRDDLGMFSTYVALRTGACGMLAEDYYSKNSDGIFESYSTVEPVLVACSELCGMKVPPLSDIVVAYKEQLISAASKYL